MDYIFHWIQMSAFLGVFYIFLRKIVHGASRLFFKLYLCICALLAYCRGFDEMSNKGYWVTVSKSSTDKLTYKFEVHTFNTSVCGKPVCSKCGLMLLKNPFTDWANKMGCQNDLHPQYKRWTGKRK